MSNLYSRFGDATPLARRLTSKLGALAIALMAIALPASAGHAAPSPAAPITNVEIHKGHLFIFWSGKVEPGMRDFIAAAIQVHASKVDEVFLVLNSPGGFVDEAESVIKLLDDVKRKHTVTTAVLSGSTCASMCVPIFLAGNRRKASGASLWLFHEIAEETPKGLITNPEMTRKMFEIYFVPAGVSSTWVDGILPNIKNKDIWRTGSELVAEKAGIITERLLPEQRAREGLAPETTDHPNS